MLTRSQVQALRREPAQPNRLALAIELAGVTQVDVAAAIGCTQSNISKLAAGKHSRLDLELTRNLADYFGCSLDDLFPAKAAVA